MRQATMPAASSRKRSWRRNPGRLVGVDAAAMQFARAAGKPAEALGAGGALDAELDGRETFPEPGRRAGEHDLGSLRQPGGDQPATSGADSVVAVSEASSDLIRSENMRWNRSSLSRSQRCCSSQESRSEGLLSCR